MDKGEERYTLRKSEYLKLDLIKLELEHTYLT